VSVSRLLDALTGVIAVAAICGTGYILLGKHPDNARAGVVESSRSEWAIANRGGHLIGTANAKIVVVEFADFECPFCDSMRPTLDSLRRLNPNVAIRFRHLPNGDIHAHATDAAIAAECAAQQRRFQEYHDVLYNERKALGVQGWTFLAARIGGIDTSAFRDCLSASAAAASAVATDVRDAHELHVDGTPTFFIGGHRITGAVPFQVLVDALGPEGIRPPSR
jgi:protein-disulfide isomerase